MEKANLLSKFKYGFDGWSSSFYFQERTSNFT